MNRVFSALSRLALTLSIAVASGFLAAPSATAATDWTAPYGPGNYLVVGIPSQCLDDETFDFTTDCNPELHLRMYGQGSSFDEQIENVSVRMADAAGHAVTFTDNTFVVSNGSSFLDPNYGSDYVEADMPGPLASGAYTFTVNYSTDGFWYCSIYDPDGCSWVAGERWAKTYKFRWDGSNLVEQAPYRGPSSRIAAVRFRYPGRHLRVSGRALGQLVDTDFRLGSTVPLIGARISLVRNGRVIRTVRTDRTGRFLFVVRGKSRARYRIRLISASNYPGATTRVYGR